MGDNYQQMFLEIDIEPEEVEWIETYMDAEWWVKNHEEEYMGFDMQLSTHRPNVLMIYSDDGHVFPDNVAWFLRRYLQTFHPQKKIVFEVSWGGDGDYGGMSYIVEAKRDIIFNTWSMANQWMESGKCEPDIYHYGDAIDEMKEAIDVSEGDGGAGQAHRPEDEGAGGGAGEEGGASDQDPGRG